MEFLLRERGKLRIYTRTFQWLSFDITPGLPPAKSVHSTKFCVLRRPGKERKFLRTPKKRKRSFKYGGKFSIFFLFARECTKCNFVHYISAQLKMCANVALKKKIKFSWPKFIIAKKLYGFWKTMSLEKFVLPFDVDARILARIYWVTRAVEHILRNKRWYRSITRELTAMYTLGCRKYKFFDPVSVNAMCMWRSSKPPSQMAYIERKFNLGYIVSALSMHFAMYRPVRCPHSLLPLLNDVKRSSWQKQQGRESFLLWKWSEIKGKTFAALKIFKRALIRARHK